MVVLLFHFIVTICSMVSFILFARSCKRFQNNEQLTYADVLMYLFASCVPILNWCTVFYFICSIYVADETKLSDKINEWLSTSI